ncbi:MAG: hypothetical protein ACD_73C00762G0002 [uncultured bacterium]|nr:MAG: hypothetical protein ACD_73C00762G0002 [uncultured bacterium]
MKSGKLKVVSFIIGLLLFGFILGLLAHQFKSYNFHAVMSYLKSIPLSRAGLAFLLTGVAYLVLTGYDYLAFQYIGHPLSFFRIAKASFIGYAFSHNLGFSMLTGAPVRYRLYSSWGISGVNIAKVVTFCLLTLFLGFMIVGGIVFLFEPPVMPRIIAARFPRMEPFGILCLVIVMCYLFWSWVQHKPLKFYKWEIPVPGPKLSIPQCFVSSMEWIITGSILFVLLPSSVSLTYPWFLGIFLLAQVAGLISQVPGGLGVFDSVIIFGLSPPLSEEKIIGALLGFRFLFYLLPLIIASTIFVIHEILLKKKEIREMFQNKASIN